MGNTTLKSRPLRSSRPPLCNGLVGRCLICRKVAGPFDPNPAGRLCTRCDVRQVWPQAEHEKLVTIAPDWKQPLPVSRLPGITSPATFDLFARWRGRPDDGLAADPGADPCEIDPFLPYPADFLRDRCQERCGCPDIMRARRLEDWLMNDNPRVFVLNMAAYLHSRTLKDLRSWAVLNAAVASGIRWLAVWTAGNAGLSLGRLATRCNHSLPPERRIRVFALFDQADESIDRNVRAELARAGCHLLHVPSTVKTIFSPAQIRRAVEGEARGLGDWHPDRYWDVTDGWEAVGLQMYRLLAAQVIRDVRPTHVVAPLGTGNLILGFRLGIDDCESSGLTPKGAVRLIGTTPRGENIVRTISRRKEMTPAYVRVSAGGPPAVMPKIATTYTPLLAIVDRELERGRIHWLEVDGDQQRRAAAVLIRPSVDLPIRSEPSSVSTFAALPVIRDTIQSGVEARILVINSGDGVLSELERSFNQSAMG